MVRNALAFAVLVVALVAAGCVTDAYSRAGGPLNVAVTAQVEAELEIGGDVKGEVEATEILGFIVLGNPVIWAEQVGFGETKAAGFLPFVIGLDMDHLKRGAAWLALQSNGGPWDAIVHPRYTVHDENFYVFEKMKVTVEGKGAKVKGYKQIPMK